MEANRPLGLPQPRYLGSSRGPWGLRTADDAEEVVKGGGGCPLLVAVGGGSDEGDVVEGELGSWSWREVEVQGVTGVYGSESPAGCGWCRGEGAGRSRSSRHGGRVEGVELAQKVLRHLGQEPGRNQKRI